ncbi:hypothetical protein J7384_18450 [Endozoicomonas sp. G2_1]|uniref:hypothetical protein n=1 Tax=Endozoicomonas sp. G2_1 TaxID=2821091 RepID=UPI001ADD0247|nr:hypothetical protein [Endozoicomonas sp. G2_1]MBO9492349.1 hypothetical protein [Endozoicomonas sp. G2_1]
MIKKIIGIVSTFIFSSSSIAKNDELLLKLIPDERVQAVAEAYSLDCIDFVKKSFNIELDYSNDSVLKLEPILDNLSNYIREKGMSDEDRTAYEKMFGFYIGETYRKNHSSVIWGDVYINGVKYWAIGKQDNNQAIFWPVANVAKRIALGKEADIAVYYKALIE